MKRWKVTRVEVNLQTIWFNLIDIHLVYLKFWNFLPVTLLKTPEPREVAPAPVEPLQL